MSGLGCHYIPQHASAEDVGKIATMQPVFVKVVWDGEPAYIEYVRDIGNIIGFLPYYIYRDHWTVSENLGVRNLGSIVEAEKIGYRHAAYMADINRKARDRGYPQKKLLYEGLNEPKVWTEGEKPERVNAYYTAFMKGVHDFGGRAVIGNFGVGWPTNRGTGTPPNWDPFLGMLDAMIVEGDYTDFLGVHEYWAWNGPEEMWGWWGGRCLKCPVNVPMFVTEGGIDGGVVQQWNMGWASLPGDSRDIKAARYLDEVWRYMRALFQDHRIQGICLFTYDCAHSDAGGDEENWVQFNISGNPFMEQLRMQIADEGLPMPQPYSPDSGGGGPVDPPPVGIIEACEAMPKNPDKSTEWPTRPKSTIERIVVHHSATECLEPTVNAEMQHLKNIAKGHIRVANWWTIGYHYCVFDSGRIYRVNPMVCTTNHVAGYNKTSVGICMIGKLHKRKPTDAQLKSTAWLIGELDWDPVPHRDLNQTACPGTWDWNDLISLIGQEPGDEWKEAVLVQCSVLEDKIVEIGESQEQAYSELAVLRQMVEDA